jgi:hypothetical protein
MQGSVPHLHPRYLHLPVFFFHILALPPYRISWCRRLVLCCRLRMSLILKACFVVPCMHSIPFPLVLCWPHTDGRCCHPSAAPASAPACLPVRPVRLSARLPALFSALPALPSALPAALLHCLQFVVAPACLACAALLCGVAACLLLLPPACLPAYCCCSACTSGAHTPLAYCWRPLPPSL